jgi:outer membrane receptor protein involved in Fe transport
MARFRPVATGVVIALAISSWAWAGQADPAGQSTSTQAQGSATQAKPPAKPEEQKPVTKPDEQKVTRKEDIVVSASKTEQQLVDAPVTMSVIGERALAIAPSGNYADILRNVPGTNISQMSARDVNLNQRGATSSLATGQLTVVDGRSVYLDFFGFTMWEFVPNDLDQIKQVEVIRGPASAVWGANALTGVVSFITKTPREMAGDGIAESFTFGIGSFVTAINHNGAENGNLFYARGNVAQAVNARWSYKVSAGYYDSDPLARPTGLIPNGGTTMYPNFTNVGSQQPRLDARVDYDFADGMSKLVIQGGYGGTTGIMNSGIGPFRIEKGASLGDWQVTYTRKAMKLQTFMNILDGSATNLVSVDPTGQPIALTFAPKTFDVEFGDTHVFGTKNAVTYGGNLRYNRFDLSIAPGENSRTEGGGYIQDEFVANEMFRFVIGARLDKFTSIADPVFSPRVAFVFKPTEGQSVRLSYNRAYRAPSMVNNHLDTVVATALPLGLVNPAFGSAVYYVPTAAVGNPDLKEESVDAYEIAYTGYVGRRTLISAAAYYTSYKDGIYFTETGVWLTAPPGFPGLGPYPPDLIWAGLVAQGYLFPSGYTYQNLGTVVNKGIELGVDTMFTDTFSGFVNYAFQADPIPSFPGLTEEEAMTEINLPSKHQFNAGISWNSNRVFGTITVSHASEAYWQDVLDARYHGFTNAYTSVNATFGVKFQDGRYMASVKATNLGNQDIQQHIFGDVIKRQVIGEFKIMLK